MFRSMLLYLAQNDMSDSNQHISLLIFLALSCRRIFFFWIVKIAHREFNPKKLFFCFIANHYIVEQKYLTN